MISEDEREQRPPMGQRVGKIRRSILQLQSSSGFSFNPIQIRNQGPSKKQLCCNVVFCQMACAAGMSFGWVGENIVGREWVFVLLCVCAVLRIYRSKNFSIKFRIWTFRILEQ